MFSFSAQLTQERWPRPRPCKHPSMFGSHFFTHLLPCQFQPATLWASVSSSMKWGQQQKVRRALRTPARGHPEIRVLQQPGLCREAEHRWELDRPAVEVPLTPGTPTRPLSLQAALRAASSLPHQALGMPGQPPQEGTQTPDTRPSDPPPGRARAGPSPRDTGPCAGQHHPPSLQSVRGHSVGEATRLRPQC